MTYYAVKASPKLDMMRHKRDEAYLRGMIEALERNPKKCEMDEAVLEAYRRCLNALMKSMRELTERIGRK